MTTTSAFVSTVTAERTVILPESIPVGAKVAVVLLPSEEPSLKVREADAERNLRFQKVMDAIRSAIEQDFKPPEISDAELDQLISEARQAARK